MFSWNNQSQHKVLLSNTHPWGNIVYYQSDWPNTIIWAQEREWAHSINWKTKPDTTRFIFEFSWSFFLYVFHFFGVSRNYVFHFFGVNQNSHESIFTPILCMPIHQLCKWLATKHSLKSRYNWHVTQNLIWNCRTLYICMISLLFTYRAFYLVLIFIFV